MEELEGLRSRLPEAARDLRLNLGSVLESSSLSLEQRLGVALASAYTTRDKDLIQAVASAAGARVSPEVQEDARAAAAIMGMNNVYYRFRHMVGKESYSTRPARLRMNAIAKPKTSRADFELMCLAASAITGCEMCVRSHERSVLEAGLTEEQVHDAVRIAAVLNGVAVGLSLA